MFTATCHSLSIWILTKQKQIAIFQQVVFMHYIYSAAFYFQMIFILERLIYDIVRFFALKE